jgi:hypothetical protein
MGGLRETGRLAVTGDREAPGGRERWKGFDLLALSVFGVQRQGGGVNIPYLTEAAEHYRTKRFPDGGEIRSYWLGESKPQIPYGLETLRWGGRTLLLTEGESDALALRMSFQRTAVLGLPGARSWRPAWSEYAARFEVVYMSFDRDRAGGELWEAVARDVPWARGVLLPEGADTRDVLQTLGRDGYKVFLEAASTRAVLTAAMRDVASVGRRVRELEESYRCGKTV